MNLLVVMLASTVLAQSPPVAQPPRTTAESSNYQATTRHADVVAFCEALAKQSSVARLATLGTSGEGRSLPMLVLAEPMVASAEEAKKSGKPVVLLFANIHAGEVDGKEGLMMLARDIALGKDKDLLKDLVVLIAPIFNADGNERLAKGKRPDQGGPDEVGDRENAGGLDLNRDFLKLESPEVRSLVKCIRNWDPAIITDMHTTNGSRHRHTMTYDGPRNPNAQAIVEFSNKFIPAAADRMKTATGFVPLPYGNFNADRTQWNSVPATPRYGVQYFGLRGRVGILSESYSYASFADRVKASQEFARGICHEAVGRKDELKKLSAGLAPRIAVRTKLVAEETPRTVLGYEEVEKDGKRVRTDNPKEYAVRFIGKSEPVLEVTRPAAYVIAPGFTSAIECLQRHGVALQELREDVELNAEIYRVNKIEKSPRQFQGHTLQRLEVSPRNEAVMARAGSIIVKTDQPLGTLAALLLEPQSEDGLATWNFFDSELKDGTDFPVVRLPQITAMHTGAVRPLPEDRKKDRPINLDLVFGSGSPPSFNGNPVSGLSWLEDGEHYLQTKSGQLLKVHARTGRSAPFADPKTLEESLKAIEGLDAEAIKAMSQRSSYTMDSTRTGAMLVHEGKTYFARFDGKPAVRLPEAAGSREYMTFSPDGQYLAFIRSANLWIADLRAGTERQLTKDGGGAILNGKADWVYEEEIFDRNAKAFWWSPDSKHLAFMRFDDTPVNNFTVVNHMPTRLNVEKYPYPKAGDPNPLVKLGIASVDGGDPRFVDFPEYKADDFIISRVGWWPDSSSVYCYVQNRVQDFLDVCTASVSNGPAKRLFRETTKAWVDNTGPLHFLPDGSFLFTSDRTGWRHLFRYKYDGTLLGPVTQGDWEVRQVHRVDDQAVWFSGTKDSHRGANLYRARLDGGEVQRLTDGPGSHSVNVAPQGDLFIDSCSALDAPTQVALRSAAGKLVRTLDSNPVYQRDDYRFGKSESVQIPLKDGFTLEGLLIYPPNFDPAKKYPIWMKTYAGPHAPTVSDTWAGGRVNDQVLASLGIVVFHVDPRSASGKGAQSTWTAYKQLGVQELKDLEEAVDWLGAKPWADVSRVGLSGHSYGGFMTAYALTHSKKWSAGVSGAPVTDWKLYDSIYTERYMHLPKVNKDGYEASSVVKAAANLHGKLLLLHGLMDDNVHVQNSVQFINELQRADKDFEVMMYPMARHGIGGRHYQRQITNFIAKSMGVDARVPSRSE